MYLINKNISKINGDYMRTKNTTKRTLFRYILATVVCLLVVVDLAILLSILTENNFIMPLLPSATAEADAYPDFEPANKDAVFTTGIYYMQHSKEEYPSANLVPNVTFNDDGTFNYVENSNEYMGHNTGVYNISSDGKTITCYVQEAVVYIPDEVVFKLDDDGVLVVMNETLTAAPNTKFYKDLV